MSNSLPSRVRSPTTARAQSVATRMHAVLRQQWARLALHGVHFSDKYGQLDNLYRMQDPWGMEAEPEQFRFRETNRLITENFDRVGSILEIGCGEGHQSRDLLKVCDELVGVDVSSRAIERARIRCPEATFIAGDIFMADLLHDRRFDLIVACEMLYYVKDVAAALARLRELADATLVTYYDLHASALDPYVLVTPKAESARVRFGTSSWTIAWWRNASQAGPAAAAK